MSGIRRQYSRDLKISIIRDIETGKPLAQAARENSIHPNLIAKWKMQYSNDPENAFKGNGRTYREEARIAELERMVGRLYAENEFLKKALKALEKRSLEERKRTRQV
jgi:transposase